MAIFFKTFDEFKSAIGGGANVSVELDSIATTIELIATTVVREKIGVLQYVELVRIYDDNETTNKFWKVLPTIQKAIAHLTMAEYSKIGGIQMSEEGLYRVENDNMKTSFRYQENQYRAYMYETGYEYLEQFLIFLEDNIADFQLYQNSDQYKKLKKQLVKYAKEYRAAISSNVSRHSFEVIYPIIIDVQEVAIRNWLPAGFYDYLITTATGVKELMLKIYLAKAIMSFSLNEAMRLNLVQFTGGKVIQAEGGLNNELMKSKIPEGKNLGITLYNVTTWGNRYIAAAKKYIFDNHDDFPKCFNTESSGTNTDTDAWTTVTPSTTTTNAPKSGAVMKF